MAECGPVDLNCKGTKLVDDITGGFATDMQEFVQTVVETVFAGWLHLPTPIISEVVGPVGFLRPNLLIIAFVILAISTVVYGIRLAFKPNRETMERGAGFYLRAVVVIGGGVTIAAKFIQVSDGYSEWIIDQATTSTGMAETLLNTLQLTGPIGLMNALFYGTIAFLLSIAQGLLFGARVLALPVLVGAAPVVVAASQSEMGMSWWTKYMSFFIAFLLYKPTAATIYAVGFWMLEEGNILAADNIGEAVISGMSFIYALMMLLLSLFAFKALMNVVTPVVGKMTGGLAGAAIIASSAAALAVGGAINRGLAPAAAPQGAPMSVTPTNDAARGPEGSQGPGSPLPNTGGTGGVPSVHPVQEGVKLGAQTVQHMSNSVSDSIDPKQEDNK